MVVISSDPVAAIVTLLNALLRLLSHRQLCATNEIVAHIRGGGAAAVAPFTEANARVKFSVLV